MNSFRRFLTIIALAAPMTMTLATPLTAHAGLGKWFTKEFVPTVTGERPLQIKPYVSVKHDGKMRFQLSADTAYIHVAGVTVKTHQLRKRLAQVGCVIETAGNVIACAPDVVQRELQNLAVEERQAAAHGGTSSSAGPPVPPPQGSIGAMQSLGWAPGWMPQVVVHCRFNDGMVIGVSAGGYVHAAMPTGYSAPVGTIRASFNPSVRFVLQNGRGNEAPVLHDGRVLDQSATQVVGFCG